MISITKTKKSTTYIYKNYNYVWYNKINKVNDLATLDY